MRGLYAKTHSGQITLFAHTFGATPILQRLFEVRGDADYGQNEFLLAPAELRRLANEATLFLNRCRAIVEAELAKGPDEPDPPPDL